MRIDPNNSIMRRIKGIIDEANTRHDHLPRI